VLVYVAWALTTVFLAVIRTLQHRPRLQNRCVGQLVRLVRRLLSTCPRSRSWNRKFPYRYGLIKVVRLLLVPKWDNCLMPTRNIEFTQSCKIAVGSTWFTRITLSLAYKERGECTSLERAHDYMANNLARASFQCRPSHPSVWRGR
jgi:hypothetical protein